MKIRGFFKNNEKIQVLSVKISSLLKKLKFFLLVRLKLDKLRNPAIISYVKLKWLAKSLANVILNGAFIFVGVHGSFFSVPFYVRIFSYGILLFTVTKLVKKIWIAYMRYRFTLDGRSAGVSTVTEYDKYVHSELAKRGIKR